MYRVGIKKMCTRTPSLKPVNAALGKHVVLHLDIIFLFEMSQLKPPA
jgi:hypothetical protein